MTLAIVHSTVATGADEPGAEINKAEWNDNHGLTGTLGVANGGTGLATIADAAILVTNAADTVTALTASGGQSVRRNAGNTAWEAFTPASPSAIAWSTKTTGYTASSGDFLLADTSSAGFTITLPATPSANNYVVIKSGYSTSASKVLTIARNGSEIMNLAEDMTVTTPNVEFTLVYNATTGWTL